MESLILPIFSLILLLPLALASYTVMQTENDFANTAYKINFFNLLNFIFYLICSFLIIAFIAFNKGFVGTFQIDSMKSPGILNIGFLFNLKNMVWGLVVTILFLLNSIFFQYIPGSLDSDPRRTACSNIVFVLSMLALFSNSIFVSVVFIELLLAVLYFQNLFLYNREQALPEIRYFVRCRFFVILTIFILFGLYLLEKSSILVSLALSAYLGSYFLFKNSMNYWSQTTGVLISKILLVYLVFTVTKNVNVEMLEVFTIPMFLIGLKKFVFAMRNKEKTLMFYSFVQLVFISLLLKLMYFDSTQEVLFAIHLGFLVVASFSIAISLMATSMYLSMFSLMLPIGYILGYPTLLSYNFSFIHLYRNTTAFVFSGLLCLMIATLSGSWFLSKKEQIDIPEIVRVKIRMFQPWFSVLLIFFASEILSTDRIFAIPFIDKQNYFLFDFFGLNWRGYSNVGVGLYVLLTAIFFVIGNYLFRFKALSDFLKNLEFKIDSSNSRLEASLVEIISSVDSFLVQLKQVMSANINRLYSLLDSFYLILDKWFLEKLLWNESILFVKSISTYVRFVLGSKLSHYFIMMFSFLMFILLWTLSGKI